VRVAKGLEYVAASLPAVGRQQKRKGVRRENSVEVGGVGGLWNIVGGSVMSMMRFGRPPWAWEFQRGMFRVMAIEDECVETDRCSDQVWFGAGIMMMEDLQHWSARYGLVIFKLESAAQIDIASAYGTLDPSCLLIK
jgi:hypothetical protein